MEKILSKHFAAAATAALVCASSFWACSDGGATNHARADDGDSSQEVTATPIDYSLGRAMNKRLGKGINLGNSWDSWCSWGGGNNDDNCWGNPIEDEDFAKIKAAGFNSVRLPVRWQKDSDYDSHTVNPDRLAGVMEDVQLAINQGLAVIVNFHHYDELNDYCSIKAKNSADTKFDNEKSHFLALWAQVAEAMNVFPDDMVVLEIINEPACSSADIIDDLEKAAYKVIREKAPGKTIMFEAFHLAKFADLDMLNLPKDGNIIYSGHYYEPYGFSHQGHSYPCQGDAAYAATAAKDLKTYVDKATKLYPDVNGGHIPMNMGEFGISGGGVFATDSYCLDEERNMVGTLPSAQMKAQWAMETVNAAEANDISWHYWGFTKVGGFEAYDRYKDVWYEGFPAAFGL